MESNESIGIWWLPGERDRQFEGRLTLQPGKSGVLKLTDWVESLATPSAINHRRDYDLVFGFIGSKRVTLKNCFVRRFTPHSLGFYEVELHARTVFVNRPRTDSNENEDEVSTLEFAHLTFGYTYLNEWMGHLGFDEQNGCVKRSEFQPLSVEIPTPKADILFSYGTRRTIGLSEYKARTKARIQIQLKDNRHIDNYRWFTELSLKNFLTLATGLPNYPLDINAMTSDRKMSTDIYQRLQGFAERSETVSYNNMLFTLADIRDHISDCLSNWFAKAAKMYPASHLYVETIDNDSLGPALRFLVLAQALESFHSNSDHKDKYMSSSKFKRIRKTIKGAISDSEFVEDAEKTLLCNLKTRINGANKYSLETRLIDNCDILSSYATGAIAEVVGDKVKFAKAVKKARNQLTHHSAKKYERTLVPALPLTDSMEVLLRCCLLTELGLPHEKVSELIWRLVNKRKSYLKPVW